MTSFFASKYEQMDNDASACPILKLPDWALFLIFRHIPQDSNLLAVKCTCHRFNLLFYDVTFWIRNELVIRSHYVDSIVQNILHYSWNSLQRVDLATCSSIRETDILTIIVKCRHIRSMALSYCVSENALLYTAVYATRLAELDISGCCSATTTFVLAVLERHGNSLQKLILSDCMGLRKGNEFDEMVEKLAKCVNIRVLDISWTKKSYTACPFHERHLICIVQGCKSLISLHISGGFVTSAVISTLTKNSPNIISLSLARTCLEDSDIVRLTKFCKKIQYLDLSSCTMITSKGFDSLGGLKCLNRLVLNNCIQLKGDSLGYILNKVPSIQHLELACCLGLVDADFSQQMFSNLKSICINQTHLTQDFVSEFMKRKTSAVITCKNCFNIEREVYAVIKEV